MWFTATSGLQRERYPDLRGMFWASQLDRVQVGLATFVMLETSDFIGISREQLAVDVGLALPFVRNGHILRPSYYSLHMAHAAHMESDAGGKGDPEGSESWSVTKVRPWSSF